MRSLHATRLQTLTLLEARAALPQAFTGLRIAAAVSVIGAVFGEYAGSEDGLGHVVLVSYGQLETARTFAATVLLFALALALYGAFALAERRLLPWTRTT
jgi:NitT/TauT family transport system permease protein/putative hydroxymethylpyrimidine transport system permease protein